MVCTTTEASNTNDIWDKIVLFLGRLLHRITRGAMLFAALELRQVVRRVQDGVLQHLTIGMAHLDVGTYSRTPDGLLPLVGRTNDAEAVTRSNVSKSMPGASFSATSFPQLPSLQLPGRVVGRAAPSRRCFPCCKVTSQDRQRLHRAIIHDDGGRHGTHHWDQKTNEDNGTDGEQGWGSVTTRTRKMDGGHGSGALDLMNLVNFKQIHGRSDLSDKSCVHIHPTYELKLKDARQTEPFGLALWSILNGVFQSEQWPGYPIGHLGRARVHPRAYL